MSKIKDYRRPKGNVNALKNNARKGAVPPDAWEDIINKKYTRVWEICRRILGHKSYKEGVTNPLNFNVFVKKVQAKFPSFSADELRKVYYYLKTSHIVKF